MMPMVTLPYVPEGRPRVEELISQILNSEDVTIAIYYPTRPNDNWIYVPIHRNAATIWKDAIESENLSEHVKIIERDGETCVSWNTDKFPMS